MASLKNMLKIKIKSNTYTQCMADCEGGVEVSHPRRPSTLSCHHSTHLCVGGDAIPYDDTIWEMALEVCSWRKIFFPLVLFFTAFLILATLAVGGAITDKLVVHTHLTLCPLPLTDYTPTII